MQELASVRRFLDGLCSGSNDSNDDSASAAPLLRLIRRVDISPGSVSILLDRNAFAACLSMGPDRIREDAFRIHAPFRFAPTRRRDQARSGQPHDRGFWVTVEPKGPWPSR